uniref:Uncharacterized protein n=1 Tax=viral metagenome TaxID=1070528 RepID=A0A6C0DMF5_9ZZZZ
MDPEQFFVDDKNHKGGFRFDDEDDEALDENDALFGGYEDDAHPDEATADMYAIGAASTTGGAKLDETDNTYVIAHSNEGYTGSRYTSKTPSGAAKKAASTIFKKMRGSKKDSATSRDRVVRSTFIVLERTRQGKCKRFYAYDVDQIQLAEPKVIRPRTDKDGNRLSQARESTKGSIVYKYKTVAKVAVLPPAYLEANKEASKKFAAAKRAKIAKENGEPVKKRKPAAKKAGVEKPKNKTPRAGMGAKKAAAPKKEKKAKKTAAATKKATVDQLILALTGKVSPAAKKGKKAAAPKKEKKAAAPKKSPKARKPRTKKTVAGGGYCSFF